MEETNLVPAASAALANRPSYLAGSDARGTEGIGSDDVKPPRLLLAQSNSPHLIRSEPKYVPGLSNGQMFNDTDGTIYGEGPLQFTVVKFLGKRGVEFAEDGKTVKDFDVPLDDPRMLFTDGPEGRRVKPIATLFYDYLILLTETNETLVFSLKSTQIKTAKTLNSLLKASLAPSFAPLLSVRVVSERNAFGPFNGLRIERVRDDKGKPAWVSEETFRYAESIFTSLEGKQIVIDREPGDDEDLPAGPVDGEYVDENLKF